ncbi:hypothetical protein PIB30_048892 [Stylosanthes scabra]|uniref:Transposase (putative) gypsy type domain-containing protein n=1 Tax=Stylosanthes scabra TaxID=79078 RepID=A0ABU6SHT5_9FABA|nr:hypothetical protein [Stylosanthes scabra]
MSYWLSKGSPDELFLAELMTGRITAPKLDLFGIEFECGVLNQLKYAPTQIHPNAWAFIRGFEILMEYLGTKPLLEVFFSFFQAKGVRKGGTVTLNSV